MDDIQEVKLQVGKNTDQIITLRINVGKISDKTERHEAILNRVSSVLTGAFLMALVGSIGYYIAQNGGV